MREYMQRRRIEQKIKETQEHIEDFEILAQMGYHGMAREMRGVIYRESDYQRDLADARTKADEAQALIARLSASQNIPAD